MREQLIKAMKVSKVLEIVYQAKDGSISQRNIRVLSIKGDAVFAYCYLRNKKRIFHIEQLLAAFPVRTRQRRIG
ncbi:hypothetical protein ACFOZY_03315 [Chungangia koreensis]|uniref:WYL domain-containing protein n=1 Tax=Chungangia koreensis TaxID=752657 RepID=A0ABV8X0N6_9LACT